jgi:hypothetical protein
MHAMLRAPQVIACLVLLVPASARGDAPAPTQALASDPAPARPSYALTADGGAILVGDYAARLDVLVVPALSIGVLAGASHRASTDDVLLEVDATLWFLGLGLDGPFLSAVAGLAWAGPWAAEGSITPRAGGQAGWQLTWDSLAISLGGGAHAALRADGEIVPEIRVRAALGVLF